MRRFSLYAVAVFLCSVAFLPADLSDDSLIGFSPGGSERQRELEREIKTLIRPENCREILRQLTAAPNMAGTPGDRRNAEYVKRYLEDLGIEAKIYEYHLYLPYPKSVEVFLDDGENVVTIRPGESGVEADPDSMERGAWPPFNAFSPSADVSGPVVYANYALPEDFELLSERGLDVRDKIVLARYGRTFRGSKVWEAEKRGAAGMILYSDPADDGYMRGDIYPEGSMRPKDAPQRGSILYMFKTPGDPLTPMEPALEGALRIEPGEAGLPKVPTVPLSYGDAEQIFRAMSGPEVPSEWQGGLPLRYRLGPSKATVRLKLEMDYRIRPVWNVIGMLRGRELPDEWVMVGCHRDAWVRGAIDPHGGNAVMLEAARVIVEASKAHGGPRRSILFCSWDAEEFGVIGSVEWVEQMKEELSARSVAYLNADAMISGTRFGGGATPTLAAFYQQVIEETEGPDGKGIWDSWRQGQIEAGSNPPAAFPFRLFGGGSDHTGFLNFVGVPCLGGGFGGRQGIYHSAYDTFRFMDTRADPGFTSHAAGVRLMTALLTRLANAEVLPISPSSYARSIRTWLGELSSLDKSLGGRALRKLDPILREIDGLSLSIERQIGMRLSAGDMDSRLARSLDGTLMALERAFIDEGGIPGRPWYRHLLFATDLSNGYGVTTLPGLKSTIQDKKAFIEEVDRLDKALQRYRNVLLDALAILLA